MKLLTMQLDIRPTFRNELQVQKSLNSALHASLRIELPRLHTDVAIQMPKHEKSL